MHTYQRTGDKYIVGFELPTGERGFRNWYAIREFDDEETAAEYTSWLNGGPKPTTHGGGKPIFKG